MSRRLPTSAWRTLTLQASFNRVGMQRGGWWFALVPWLRRRGAEGSREWFGRQRAVFNTNPYLAPVLLGARCRIEEDQSPELADRIEITMQRTFGSLGDALGWRAFRPLWFLVTALAGFVLGPVAVLVAWLLFGGAIVTIHHLGLAWGYRNGLDVVDRLSQLPLHAIAAAGRKTSGVLAGAVGAGLVAMTIAADPSGPTLVLAGVAIGVGYAVARLRRAPEWWLWAGLVGLILYARWTGEFPEAVLTW
jgi:mannose/fructose/N-acetylgalactosamine-specific phosphotransferase system component IID